MYIFNLFSLLVISIWIMISVTSILHMQVEGAYGDHCSQNDTSNCTVPELICLPSMICGCNQGFVPDTTGPNGTVCRLPHYNETCNIMVGCEEIFDCIDTLNSSVCGCEPSYKFYNDTAGLCQLKPIYNQSCDAKLGCEEFNECEGGANPTCQCNTLDVYFDSLMFKCLQMSDLKAKILSTFVTHTSVALTWEEQNPDLGVYYQIYWTPSDGKLDFNKSTGGQVSNLQGGVVYNFTITTVLPANAYNQEKSVSQFVPSLRTMRLVKPSPDPLEIGVIIGVVVFVTIVAFVGIFLYRRRKARTPKSGYENPLNESTNLKSTQY